MVSLEFAQNAMHERPDETARLNAFRLDACQKFSIGGVQDNA